MPEFTKAHPKKNKAFTLRWAQKQKQRCQVCYITIPSMWLAPDHTLAHFERHHIIRGENGRSDEACNLLLLCYKCHQERSLLIGHFLWVKSQTSEWDEKRLRALAHRWYELEELPAVYLRERERNRLNK